MEVQDLDWIGKSISDLRKERDFTRKKLKELNNEIDVKEELLISHLVKEGKDNWQVKGVGIFSIARGNYYKVNDKDKLRDWMLNNNMAYMLTVNSNTLRGWLNEGDKKNIKEMGVSEDPRTDLKLRRES